MHIPKEFQYFNNLRLVFWCIASFQTLESTYYSSHHSDEKALELHLFIYSLCMGMLVVAMLVCLGATAWMWLSEHSLWVSALSIMCVPETEPRFQGLVAYVLTCGATLSAWMRTLNDLLHLMIFIKHCTCPSTHVHIHFNHFELVSTYNSTSEKQPM